MLEYKKITLSNGLRFLYHEDRTTPMVALNVLYDVGARDEDKERTGFAHLFESVLALVWRFVWCHHFYGRHFSC